MAWCITLSMASIIKKNKGGRIYYYLAESARVNGKPRIVKQTYLGKAEDVAARLERALKPDANRYFEFGCVSAAYTLAKRLDIASIIDGVLPKRHQGLSVGDYLLLAIVNRVSAPCSKAKMATWYEKSSLARLMRVDTNLLKSQRFYDAFDRIDERALAKVEELLSRKVIEEFSLDTKCLVFDATNFFTYIDSDTPTELAKRGHSKAKRDDLKQIGLALLVSKDSAVPLMSEVYPGNRPDQKTFLSAIGVLEKRYRDFARELADITLVFDKGNNSHKNFALLGESPYHFVGSLVPSHHKDLLARPRSSFYELGQDFEGTSCFRAEKEVFGALRTIVVTHSEEFHQKQLRGFAQTLRKARKNLAELRAILRRGRTRRDRASIEQETEKILSPRWVSQVLKVNLAEDEGKMSLTWKVDQHSFDELEETFFGKRVLFTDRADFTDEEIIRAYRSQSVVEGTFRQMKNASYLSFSPVFHWTDPKIRVHAFCCTIALMLVNLMVRLAKKEGVDISPNCLLDALSGIKESEMLYRGVKGRPKVVRMITDMDELQAKLFDIFSLSQFAP